MFLFYFQSVFASTETQSLKANGDTSLAAQEALVDFSIGQFLHNKIDWQKLSALVGDNHQFALVRQYVDLHLSITPENAQKYARERKDIIALMKSTINQTESTTMSTESFVALLRADEKTRLEEADRLEKKFNPVIWGRFKLKDMYWRIFVHYNSYYFADQRLAEPAGAFFSPVPLTEMKLTVIPFLNQLKLYLEMLNNQENQSEIDSIPDLITKIKNQTDTKPKDFTAKILNEGKAVGKNSYFVLQD